MGGHCWPFREEPEAREAKALPVIDVGVRRGRSWNAELVTSLTHHSTKCAYARMNSLGKDAGYVVGPIAPPQRPPPYDTASGASAWRKLCVAGSTFSAKSRMFFSATSTGIEP